MPNPGSARARLMQTVIVIAVTTTTSRLRILAAGLVLAAPFGLAACCRWQ